MNQPDPIPDLPACDLSRKYVRPLAPREDGRVAFEFSIGWPELCVELLLPAQAFAEFCAEQRVELLPQRPDAPENDTEETTE